MPDRSPSVGSTAAGSGSSPILRLDPHITAAEALAVFRRKLPGATATVESVVHPFWLSVLGVRTRGVFSRPSRRTTGSQGPSVSGQRPSGHRLNVLVNAVSGRGFLADFEPRGEATSMAEWASALGVGDAVPVAEASRVAHSLVRTKVVRTVKLGMRIDIDEIVAPRGVLKPNWLVTGENTKHRATILVDGLDSSHYIVRVEKL